MSGLEKSLWLTSGKAKKSKSGYPDYQLKAFIAFQWDFTCNTRQILTIKISVQTKETKVCVYIYSYSYSYLNFKKRKKNTSEGKFFTQMHSLTLLSHPISHRKVGLCILSSSQYLLEWNFLRTGGVYYSLSLYFLVT